MTVTNDSTTVITGTAGFIGYHLALHLLRNNKRVIGIDNLAESYYPSFLKKTRLLTLETHSGYTHLYPDLTESDLVSHPIIASASLDSIVHLAAQASVPWSLKNPNQCYKDNVLSFATMLGLYEEYELRHFIYASTSSVYGKSVDTSPIPEDRITNSPVSPYGASKIANEMMAQASFAIHGKPLIGLRFFKVYGPSARPDTVFFKFVDDIWHERPVEIRNHGHIEHSFTFVDDIVGGISSILAKDYPCLTAGRPSSPLHPRYNLGNPSTVQLSLCVDIIERLLNRKADRRLVALPTGDRAFSCANIDSACADFQFSATTPVCVGLDHFVDWYLEEYLPLLQK